MRERKFKLNENKTEIMLINGNLRTNVTHEFNNLDAEASTNALVNTAHNLGISFDELSFKKQIDRVFKSSNPRICHICYQEIFR